MMRTFGIVSGLVLASASATAEPVTFQFTGTVTANALSAGPFAGAMVGDTAVLVYTFDDAAVPTTSSPTLALYDGAIEALCLTIGGTSITVDETDVASYRIGVRVTLDPTPNEPPSDDVLSPESFLRETGRVKDAPADVADVAGHRVSCGQRSAAWCRRPVARRITTTWPIKRAGGADSTGFQSTSRSKSSRVNPGTVLPRRSCTTTSTSTRRTRTSSR